MRSSAKSGLFLIEMIIAIMFFALCGATCTSLFVGAHVLSEETRKVNMAVSAAQSVAECFKAADGSIAQTALLLGTDPGIADFENSGGDINLYYDSDWQRVMSSDHAYKIMVLIDEDAALRDAHVAVLDAHGGNVIYTLEAKKYVP